jgi:hypothetical protein
VRQLISKAMSVPCFSSNKAYQEECLLLLLIDQEPDARQLLHQHLFKADKAKLNGAELSSSNFPGSAYILPSFLVKSHDSMAAGVQTAQSEAFDSSTDGSPMLDAYADLEGPAEQKPSAGLCKALDVALFITRQQGKPWHDLCTAVTGWQYVAKNARWLHHVSETAFNGWQKMLCCCIPLPQRKRHLAAASRCLKACQRQTCKPRRCQVWLLGQ